MKEWRVTAVGNKGDAVYFDKKEQALAYVKRVLEATDNKIRLLIEHYTSHYDEWFRWYIEYDSAFKNNNGRF